MKLNLGSSDVRGKYRTGWVNLDIVKHGGVSVVGSGIKLPFRNNSFDEIHCVHVLEHVTRDKYFPMLCEMIRVLKPQGKAYIEVPDFISTLQALVSAYKNSDSELVHKWTTSVYGKNEREGMAHHWGFTDNLLYSKMREAGFIRVNRSTEMISGHHRQEPVLLMVGQK